MLRNVRTKLTTYSDIGAKDFPIWHLLIYWEELEEHKHSRVVEQGNAPKSRKGASILGEQSAPTWAVLAWDSWPGTFPAAVPA